MKEAKHGSVAAMPQFNKDHWVKDMSDTEVFDGKYSSEMNQAEEYKEMVNGLARYAKTHKAKH